MVERDETQALIAELAQSHGVRLSSDDPVLMLHSLNQHLLQQNSKAQAVLLDQFKSELEDISARWADENITRAENILNAALLANKNAIDNQIQHSMKSAVLEINKAVENAHLTLASTLKHARLLAMMITVGWVFLVGVIGFRLLG